MKYLELIIKLIEIIVWSLSILLIWGYLKESNLNLKPCAKALGKGHC